jgi:high affinity Mn2+ porin
VGGHLGYAGGRSNWSAGPDLSSSLDLFQSSDIFTGAGSYFGGLQIGYDYMLPNRIVLGAQLDVSGLPTQQHLHRRHVDLLHAGHRPGEL